ncbi:RecB family exonuclease [Pasteurella testudinis]|uniref:RecB family exonuclease n=1 Tax=Pasteurella testudinis TaxID=761 RepID=UPI0040599BE2
MQFKPDGAVGKTLTGRPPVINEPQQFVPKPHEDKNKIDTEFESGLIAAWSFSSLSVFEQCPKRSEFKSVQKIKEPSSPALERGSQIHDLAERYVRGQEGDDVPAPLQLFKRGFEELKQAFADGKVHCEDEWAFRKDWSLTEWNADDCWHRAKLDALLIEDDGSALIIDYKTGKKFGNELKHGEQGLTYAIDTFLRYPDLDFIKVEFWYLDKGEKLVREYTRQQALLFHPQLHQRAKKMTTTIDFPAQPSMFACKWCYYGKEGLCKDVFDASQL